MGLTRYTLPYESWNESCWVVSNSLRPLGLYSPWNSPGQNAGVSCLSLLQGIFPTQESNPCLLHSRRILYQLSHQGSPTRCFLTPDNLPGPQLLPPRLSNSSSGCLQSYTCNLHSRRPSAGSSQKPCDLGTSTLSPDPRSPSPLSSN